MDKLFGLGRFLFAAGVLGLGVQALICGAPASGLEPIAPSAPGGMLLANATGVGLVVLAGPRHLWWAAHQRPTRATMRS